MVRFADKSACRAPFLLAPGGGEIVGDGPSRRRLPIRSQTFLFPAGPSRCSIGFQPRGGYDLYGAHPRPLYIGRHIPGQSQAGAARNMPGRRQPQGRQLPLRDRSPRTGPRLAHFRPGA